MAGQPELITRGFVNEKEADDLLAGAEDVIARVLSENSERGREAIRGRIEQALNRYLYDETRKRPVVEVVVK
jgi:mRNA degradation ribonuclease J1/J2